MNYEEKLKQANQLKQDIEKLKDFIAFIQNGQKYNERYKTQNYFYHLSLSARICTGSDSPSYENELTDKEDIKKFVNAGIETLEIILKEKTDIFENIFKN
jgi:hypothetical protein